MATLKISDLSVGDWVLMNGEPAKALRLTMAGRTIFKGLSGQIYGSVGGDIFPMPIVPDILEANGFVEDDNGHCVLKIGGIVAADLEYAGGIWELSILDVYALQYAGKMQVTIAFVSSIHSLQHALRLAGVDKEIVMPKK